jgi:tetratricopeptide (TPR) repeat protein
MVALFRKFEEANWATNDKRLDDAAAALDALVRQDPPNPVFRGALARVERQRGHARRAIELYRDAVAYAPDDAQSWYNLASALQETGDLAHAADAAREVLRRDAQHADAHNVLGIVQLGRQNPAGALDEFQRAIAADPRNARAYNNIGNVARALHRDADAEAAFEKAIALAPAYADPLNGLGALDIDRNRYAEAIACFDRALRIAPAYAEARLNRAVALQLGGDARGAIGEYRTFLAQTKNAPEFAAQRRGVEAMLARLETAAR